MFSFFKKRKLVVTHNGTFHTDDLFAAGVVELCLEQKGECAKIIRTRDEEIIQKADIVFDVGGRYDASSHRYDHHQHEGAGVRENGIPYASIGLVWKHWGMELCDNNEKVWQSIDEKLVQPIDADDVGISLYEVKQEYDNGPYIIQYALKSFYTAWNEPERFDEQFMGALKFVKEILKNEIHQAKARAEAAALVERDYEANPDKKIITLANAYPWKSVISEKDEPLLVIYPRHDGTWGIEGVPVKDGKEFEIRMKFPESWAGLRTDKLAAVSGIDDARFCHNGRWLCVTGSKEGALSLAQKALDSTDSPQVAV